MIILSYKASLACTYEVQYVVYFGRVGNLLLHLGEQVFQQSCTLQYDLVGAVDVIYDVAIETTSAQSHGVQAAVCGRVACYHGVWQDVLCAACATANHAVAADAAELVYEHVGRKDGAVVYSHFAGQFCAVANDAFIANDVVVGDVYPLHEQVAAAYHCLVLGSGTTVYGDILAEGVVVSNFRSCLLAMELQVLWNGSYDGTGEEFVTISYSCTVKYGDTVHQYVIVADYYILVDIAERANLTILSDLCFGVDEC